ncbi:formate dehydrogenase accessory sulfurtransferase FdhD [Massilia sp. CMS3.1]|uniref:formate dehydrogenase accessory sulfurtransferase FdhD n=1 Tax=Massilia sp. CMS3.1 TaxID=3373083 RepID=UPI003EE50562
MKAAEPFLAMGGHEVPEGTRRLAAIRCAGEAADEGSELVADEVPVALSYNGVTHAVMLASPLDLEDFALGFTLGERIVRKARDVYDIEVEHTPRGIAIALRIASGALARLKVTRSARLGKTGCGLCGVDSLEYFEQDACLPDPCAPQPACSTQRIEAAALHRAMVELAARQQLHGATGAAHAAGWAGLDGALLCMREDVGRHNALDKLVGALARSGTAPDGGFAVVTSRASFEMVQKAARAGFGLLAAISAPTALAVRMAEGAGLTLAGFVRGGRHVVYSHPQRLLA